LLALTTGYPAAVAANTNPVGHKDPLHLVNTESAVFWGRQLLNGNSNPDISNEGLLAYLGTNYLDPVSQHGASGAAQILCEYDQDGFGPLHFMRLPLEHYKPDVVVATNSPCIAQAAFEVTVSLGSSTAGRVDLSENAGDNYLTQ